MNIAILGYGKEGKSVENYQKSHNNTVKIFDDFTKESLSSLDLSSFDMVFRSPSVYPYDRSWSSVTKFFFDNCICPIIGVTGTKGKGTTCTIITELLRSLGKTVHLVGNIGAPAIDILDNISPDDVVVYELSSFQLWDLAVSPQISVILRIEPDHLNVHDGMEDYINAKSHICAFQSPSDSCIYFKNNNNTKSIVEKSQAKKFPYPLRNKSDAYSELLSSLSLPGAHNRENCEAALLACAAYFNEDIDSFAENHKEALKTTLSSLKGLPHRMEFLRDYEGIKIYDDNFSTTIPSLDVALSSFPGENLILILGGRDKTAYEDLKEIKSILDREKDLKHIILIGESGHELKNRYDDPRFVLAESLEDAVSLSIKYAKASGSKIILMSPAAASFDMFENVYDRGEKFQKIIKSL